MARFARIENGIISEYSTLEDVWVDTRNNVKYSNLKLWPETDRNSLGWFEVVEAAPQVKEKRVEVQDGKPVAVYELTPAPPPPAPALQDQVNALVQVLVTKGVVTTLEVDTAIAAAAAPVIT